MYAPFKQIDTLIRVLTRSRIASCEAPACMNLARIMIFNQGGTSRGPSPHSLSNPSQRLATFDGESGAIPMQRQAPLFVSLEKRGRCFLADIRIRHAVVAFGDQLRHRQIEDDNKSPAILHRMSMRAIQRACMAIFAC